jgi:uncharacterized membrane protein YeaQ/YmgE (transglycosylase-associated protein family)
MQAPTLDEQALGHAWKIIEVAVVSALAGWVAEHVLDSGLKIPGTAIVYGLTGFYLGTWLAANAGWEVGPTVADYAIVPIFVGALLVSAVAKLVGLGAAGPRR